MSGSPRLIVHVLSPASTTNVTGPVVARSQHIVSSRDCVEQFNIDDTLDDLFFDHPPAEVGWHEKFIERLRSASIDEQVTYLVPLPTSFPDATLRHLIASQHSDISVHVLPENLSDTFPVRQSCRLVIDWVDLRGEMAAAPFAAGSSSLSSVGSKLITNVPGKSYEALQELLRRFVRSEAEIRVYGHDMNSQPEVCSLSELSSAPLPEIFHLYLEAPSYNEFNRTPLDLQRIVARLRAPGGCPWDRVQDHESLSKNLIEEAYELLDAIERNASEEIQEELGDYILQAWMHAQIAEERGAFTLEDVFGKVTEKLVRRHPHVFSDTSLHSPDAVVQTWDEIKRQERTNGSTDEDAHPLGKIPTMAPALMRAQTVIKRASRNEQISRDMSTMVEAALDLSSSSPLENDILRTLIDTISKARAGGVDVESLLRAWSRTFEDQVREEFREP